MVRRTPQARHRPLVDDRRPDVDDSGKALPAQAVPAARLAAVEASLRRALTNDRAPATLRAYTSDWADFTAWCAGVGADPLPAAPTAVAGYLSELAFPPDDRNPLAASTITRRVAAIGQVHLHAGHPNPCTEPLVRTTMRGVRRALGTAPTQKRAVTTEEIAAAVAQLGDRPADVRDRALLLVGFAGGMRRSELAALTAADVADVPEGMLVTLRRSKTDQEGRGRRIEIVYGTHPATCPVRAWRAWRHLAGAVDGPLLRRVDRHGRVLGPLSAQGVALVVKRHMGRLGHPATDFAGHSLRRGHATTAARNGASERTIMATTGHTSVETLRRYVDDAQLFSDPASSYLGL